jgi:hypothetical protein
MFFKIVIFLLAIPFGFLVAWLARDELRVGVKYFRILMIASMIFGIWFWLNGKAYIAWTLSFIFVVSLISFVKSSDKKWTKAKI